MKVETRKCDEVKLELQRGGQMSAIKSTFQIAPNCYSAALLLLSASQASAASYTSVRQVLHDTHDTSVRLRSGMCFMIDQLQCQQEGRSEEPR